MAARKRSRNGICVGFIFFRAIASVKNSARSISGNCLRLPECGGHSISNKFDLTSNDSGKSPSNAQPCTVLPPFCIMEPSSMYSRTLLGRNPTSSSNSICARVSKSSLGAASPFGIVHAPSSLWTWKGPPGCASRTSTLFFVRRNINRPALIRLRLDLAFLDMSSFCAGDALDRLCQRRVFFFAAPDMKSVSEDDVSEQIVVWTIIDIERRIELEVWCDVTCETDCR